MTTSEIKQLFKLFNSKRIIDLNEWVMGSCPFAKYTHAKQTDNKPSFGIRKGHINTYHCFSCNKSGFVSLLPTTLEFMGNESYQHIREFLQFSTSLIQEGSSFEEPINKTLKEIPLSVFYQYPVMKEWNNLTKTDIANWDIRYDPKYNRILYPIFNIKKILFGIRGRSLTEKLFISYTHLISNSLDPKSGGLWFGMQFELKPNKALLLVEGERDAILLKRYASNVWASMGSSVAQKQLETISQLAMPIIIFFDNDRAGKEGMTKILKNVGKRRCITIANFYGCKDPAEAVERNLITKILQSNNLKGA